MDWCRCLRTRCEPGTARAPAFLHAGPVWWYYPDPPEILIHRLGIDVRKEWYDPPYPLVSPRCIRSDCITMLFLGSRS